VSKKLRDPEDGQQLKPKHVGATTKQQQQKWATK
jgi:hypothetical protein